jgi:hypothetical protein
MYRTNQSLEAMLEAAIRAKLQLKVFWQLGHALGSGAGGLGSLGVVAPS